eukprot:TRINITY_DN38532_c0_g2_i8.p1 TRINITY_DN38532_c0_g2~~TRINITY_DN38532_c0_g2_i8.p1  ORF type:complete len:100 (-),score=9.12 TRINITY_DN38532_c0_g2_i8:353-652(-)
MSSVSVSIVLLLAFLELFLDPGDFCLSVSSISFFYNFFPGAVGVGSQDLPNLVPIQQRWNKICVSLLRATCLLQGMQRNFVQFQDSETSIPTLLVLGIL